jgi:alpha-beta hydrolase superfamily lysophospholipase
VFILASYPELSAFPPDHEARLKTTHPDVEVVRLAGASHSIHDERAHRDEYARRLDAFLS